MHDIIKRLNVIAECRAAHLSLWSCPPFLFVIMGLVNVVAMIASYLLASRYVEEPELAALVVIVVAFLIFIIGNSIIQGFSKMAEASRIKTEFIAIVSHQLRSPLSVFKWTIGAMNSKLPREKTPSAINGSIREYLQTLGENSERMIQLVNMLLEVSRIEGGRLVLRREPVRLDAIIEGIVRSFANYARASNVTIEYSSPRELPPVRGDRERIKMVVENLIDNAVRYSRGGSGHVVVTTTLTGDSIELKVQDSGMGIAEDDKRFVFQKFFRSKEASRRESSGSGLGLYIVSSIVKNLGGKAGFKSEEGRGSTFWIRLPTYSA